MSEVSGEDFLALYCRDENVCVVDVRSQDEFGRKRLPKAQCIPVDDLEAQFSKIPKNEKVYLLCQSGLRAKRAQEKLENLGFNNVTAIQGGLTAIEKADRSQVQVFNRVIPIMRQVQITAGLMVFLGVLLSILIDSKFIYLSGFVGLGLFFSGVTGTCLMANLLSKMPWNRVRN